MAAEKDATAALLVQWLPALANLAGTRYVGAVQLVSTVLKFVPLLLVAIGGLFFFDPDNLGPFQATEDGALGAVSASAAILLFSYLGVESAAVSAGEVRNPRRNVGRATVLGTIGAALVYLLGTLSVFGTVPHVRLLTSGAPFTDAVNAMFGGTWAARPSPARRWCRSWARSTDGRCSAPRPRTPPPAMGCSLHASP